MKTLILCIIVFIFSGYSCDGIPEPGYQSEPFVHFSVAFNDSSYSIYLESVNIKKHLAKRNDSIGIDMNANQTKYWFVQGNKLDSFTLNYSISFFDKYNKNWINFDTIYLHESSFSRNSLEWFPEHPHVYLTVMQ